MSHHEPVSRGKNGPGGSGDDGGPERDEDVRRIGFSRTLARLLPNWVAVAGWGLFLTCLVTFAFLLTLEVFAAVTNPYLGLFHYLVLPPAGTAGLALAGVGLLVERRRRRRGVGRRETRSAFDITRIDVQRRVLVVGGGFACLAVFLMAFGGYRSFEYTESVEFCGETCHVVMEPEFTAYQHSPHARVTCVECHVGSGADWYVRSKLSGLYQVYATARDIFPRPIPTPIENLRPAQETCERCHWPSHFYGARQKTYLHYPTFEIGEPWRIDLLVEIGGGRGQAGYERGIHWHMNLANEVEYIARDEALQDVAWVRLTDPSGEVTIYSDAENPPDPELLEGGEIHRMDCIDCHNRPSHVYDSPLRALNNRMALGQIDPSLPDFKLTAMEALIEEYETKEAGLAGVESFLMDHYRENYPELVAERGEALSRSVDAVQDIYRLNFFPEMNVRWDVYPDNSTHWSSPGCFRCHAGDMVSEDGRTVSYECNTCHIVLRQGQGDDLGVLDPDGRVFLHPGDLEEMEAPVLCHECHNGVLGL